MLCSTKKKEKPKAEKVGARAQEVWQPSRKRPHSEPWEQACRESLSPPQKETNASKPMWSEVPRQKVNVSFPPR